MNRQGMLYVVATPIGNLGDIGFRAVEILGKVDHILAEDTRHSRVLLNHLGIKKPLSSVHAHNESAQAARILDGLAQGLHYALISDAGTPLISDPGSYLVSLTQQAGFSVVPIPGACAVIAALSASGIATDRFSFEGFLAAKKKALEEQLQTVLHARTTTVFFETPHRIVRTLEAMLSILGPEREIAIARELTKTFETIKRGPLAQLVPWVAGDPMQQKGEYVLIVSGAVQARKSKKDLDPQAERLMEILLEELSPSQATRLAAKITGIPKQVLYSWAIESTSAKR